MSTIETNSLETISCKYGAKPPASPQSQSVMFSSSNVCSASFYTFFPPFNPDKVLLTHMLVTRDKHVNFGRDTFIILDWHTSVETSNMHRFIT